MSGAGAIVVLLLSLVGAAFFVVTRTQERNRDRALLLIHEPFVGDARRALEPLELAHVEDVRSPGEPRLEITFPSSRHRSVVRVRRDISGALVVDLTTPIRDAVPSMLSIRSVASVRHIHVGKERVTQRTLDLDSGDMTLAYGGQSVTARLADLMHALTPELLEGLRAEASVHRARVESVVVANSHLELEVVYPGAETTRLAALVKRLVDWSAHAHIESPSPGAFWRRLYFKAPANSAARLGALSSLMGHAPDSDEARDLHAHVLEREGTEALYALYTSSPHPFFSRMSGPRLQAFLGHLLSRGDHPLSAIPATAFTQLDARALGARALPASLRIEVFERLDDTDEAIAGHAATLYSALSDQERGDLLARTKEPNLSRVTPALIDAARALGVVHVASDPRLASEFTFAVERAVANGTLAWDEPLELILARLTLGHERAAKVAADLLIEHGSEHALRALSSLNTHDASGGHAARATTALARRLGSSHLAGAMTVAPQTPDALRGALTRGGEAGALSSAPHEEEPP